MLVYSLAKHGHTTSWTLSPGYQMKRIFASAAIAALFAACATEPGGDVSGGWDITESLTSQTGITCQLTGDMILSQASNGARFTGQRARQGTCVGAPVGYDPGGVFGITDGDASGQNVSFMTDFCSYEGTIAEPNMNGTVQCDDGLSGLQSEVFSGTWQATRTAT